MLTGAIIGAFIGLFMVLIINVSKNQRFNKLRSTVQNPDYAGLYHYASQSRYNKSMKFFDSYGLLYISGKNLCYKTTGNGSPMEFDLGQCTAQEEPDWRKMKWFSVTTPVGERHYFNSHKLGAFVNDSSETLKGLAAVKTAMASAKQDNG